MDDLNLLIKEINEEAFEFYEEDKKQLKRDLHKMMIYVIKKDYNKSLSCFKNLDLKYMDPNDYLWSTYIVTKIYMFLKDYKQAKKLLFHKDTFEFYEKAIKDGEPLSVMDNINRLQDYFFKKYLV